MTRNDTVVADTREHRTRTNRVPRSRGAVSGLLLILLGAWGALVPFIGPYFDYSYGSDKTWDWTTGRGWLEVLPGAVCLVGGFLLLTSKSRIRGSFGAWLAVLAGAWFVIGKTVASWWHTGGVGEPLSRHVSGRAVADLGYFYGLGAVILFLAAFALGRLAVVGVRDIAAAERDDERAAEQARRDAELSRQRDEQWAAARRDEADRADAPRAEAGRSDRAVDEAVAPTSAGATHASSTSARPASEQRVTDDAPTYDGQSDYNERRVEDGTTATGYDTDAAGRRLTPTDPPADGRRS